MSSKPGTFKNPFSRPWMSETGAAAAAGGSGSVGMKGVVAGGITGGIEICITFPTEYVKTQLQLDEKGGTKKYTGIIDCVSKTVKGHGFLGLYRGLSVLLYGSIPKSAVRFVREIGHIGIASPVRILELPDWGLYLHLTGGGGRVVLAVGDAVPNAAGTAIPLKVCNAFGVFEQAKLYMVKEDGTLSTAGKLGCGLAAGVAEAIFAVTPMETVKVKFINDMRMDKPRFKGFFHGVRTIVREEGVGGVYKGVTATVMKQGSNQAIRFFVMESLRDWYKGGDRNKPVPKYIVALFGGVAGAASVFGNTPIDVVKTRMQGLEASKYKSTWDCFFKTWKHEGPLAFYKGTVPRLSRVVFDVAITFTIYDSIMDMFNFVWK